MEQSEAASDLSRLGIIGPWYLRESQLDIYELLLIERRPFIECSRRFGKTTAILCFVFEKLWQNPGWICRWCEPWQHQARTIVMPIINKLQTNVPKSKRFKYQTTDSVYKCANGSMMYLMGVNDDKGESARGPASNIIVCDEYGTWKEASYIVKDILSPQLQEQEGRYLIKTSTPPKNLGHVYYEDHEEARREKRLLTKIIWDKENLLKEELDEIIKDTGGEKSTTFRREYLCEHVTDPESLVIREWAEKENELTIEDDEMRPAYFDAYVGGDSGFDDNTFIVFGYFDFKTDTVIIEDELIINNATSKEIVSEAKKKETDLWKDKKPYLRVYDADKQLIYDVATTESYVVSRPEKHQKKAAINALRVRIRQGKLKIKRRCENLRRQLRVGLWKDENHKDFERTEGLGHLDGIAALIYLNRHVNTNHNPWPKYEGVSNQTHFIPQSKELKGLANAFKRSR